MARPLSGRDRVPARVVHAQAHDLSRRRAKGTNVTYNVPQSGVGRSAFPDDNTVSGSGTLDGRGPQPKPSIEARLSYEPSSSERPGLPGRSRFPCAESACGSAASGSCSRATRGTSRNCWSRSKTRSAIVCASGTPVSIDARSVRRDDVALTHVRRHTLARLDAVALLARGEVPWRRERIGQVFLRGAADRRNEERPGVWPGLSVFKQR
jgi:hypothetical protein